MGTRGETFTLDLSKCNLPDNVVIKDGRTTSDLRADVAFSAAQSLANFYAKEKNNLKWPSEDAKLKAYHAAFEEPDFLRARASGF